MYNVHKVHYIKYYVVYVYHFKWWQKLNEFNFLLFFFDVLERISTTDKAHVQFTFD